MSRSTRVHESSGMLERHDVTEAPDRRLSRIGRFASVSRLRRRELRTRAAATLLAPDADRLHDRQSRAQ